MNLVFIDRASAWLALGEEFKKLKQRWFARPPKSADDYAREAAELREMAYRYLKTDPGFAGDLFAAANRHESSATTRAGL